MKRQIKFLLCIFLVLLLTACELPEDSSASSVPASGGGEIPTTSVPASGGGETPTSSVPASGGGQTPTTSAPAPGGGQTPTTSAPASGGGQTPPTSTPGTGGGGSSSSDAEPKDDFLKDFMAKHNAGEKFTYTYMKDTYEISVNTATKECSVIRKHTEYDKCVPLAMLGYYFDKPTTQHFTYYYSGTLSPASDGSLFCGFDYAYLGVEFEGVSKAGIEKIREYLWDNLRTSEWQEAWLTKEECELWEVLLDGHIARDIRTYQTRKLEMSVIGSKSVQIMLYNTDGSQDYSCEIDSVGITCTLYHSGSYETSYSTHDGGLQFSQIQYDNGAYSRDEYNSRGELVYNIYRDKYGDYRETRIVRNNGTTTKTIEEYKRVDKNGTEHYLNERRVDVYRNDPDNPSNTIYVSSHIYDKNNKLIKCFVYDTAGKLTESLVTDDAGLQVHKVNTYDGQNIIKTVETTTHVPTNTVEQTMTTEYIYSNGKLIKIQVTLVRVTGEVETWEEPLPDASASPT